MRNRLILAFVAMTAITGLLTAAAEATQVGNGVFGQCQAGEFCTWRNSNYSSSVADWSGDANVSNYNQWEYWNTTTTIDNKTSSTKDFDSDAIQLWQNISYGGTVKCYDNGEVAASYGDFDNKASSHYIVGACGGIGP